MIDKLRYLSQKYPNWEYIIVNGKGYNFKQLLSEVEKETVIGKAFLKICSEYK